MTDLRDLHEVWMKDPDYRREYDDMEDEFALASAAIRACFRMGLIREEFPQSVIATRE